MATREEPGDAEYFAVPPRANRGLIMIAVMAAMFMAALEGTVVGTAMPSISRRLGDLTSYTWVFTGYLMAQTVTALAFGRLADVAGRKIAIVVGLAGFVVGSIACGFAWSMPALITFRIVQGIGAGAIMPLCMTIVGDLYPPHERGKAQSLVATVFGTSSVVGPLLGGIIVQQFSWSWVFWINVPIGLIAIIAFCALLPSHTRRQGEALNLTGNVLLGIALAASLSSLSWFGANETVLAMLAAAVAICFTLAFVRIEAKSPAPIFAADIWRQASINRANLATAFGSTAIIGLTAFLPLFMQLVLGASPVKAGLALTAIALGWPLGATFAGWYQLKIGLRRTMMAGSVLVCVGAIGFVLLNAKSSFFHAASGSFLMGAGMGLLTSAAIMVVQEAVEPAKRGIATGANVFARNLGGVLGAAAFGALFNVFLRDSPTGMDIHELERQLSAGANPQLSPNALFQISAGLHWVFVAMAIIAAGTVITVLTSREVTAPSPSG